jgi:hypothetical protein
MNPLGIAVFYGSDTEKAAIAEVRPPVGSRVLTARFELLRPLRLLDLTAIEEIAFGDGSIFDPAFGERVERLAFLRSLGGRLSRPVMPDDEAFEYLITQVVADYLASQPSPGLDGIIFSSAQAGSGRNVALFHHASFVQPKDDPPEDAVTVYGAWGDANPLSGPAVWVDRERAKKETGSMKAAVDLFLDDLDGPTEALEVPIPTLQLDLESVAIHEVARVQVETVKHEIGWYDNSEPSDF